MNERIKLTIALQQVENLVSLFEGNPYEKFLNGHLVSIQVELQRQLTLATVFDDGRDPNP
jgi:hypothetical protein